MRQAGKIIKGLPGNLYDNAYQDATAGSIMAISIWESQEALKGIRFEERKPAPVSFICSIHCGDWDIAPFPIRQQG